MKTYSAKPSEVIRKWYVIDAAEAPLGRISTIAARLLTGKHKPMFTPHIDSGDYVIIINAANLIVTGNKMNNKVYYRHSQYPGGIKKASLKERVAKDPTAVIYHAIRGMIPVNKLRDGRVQRLKIYARPEHQHEAQKPVKFNLKAGK